MTGNLLISLIAGTLTTVVLLALGVPFAVALGLIVAILDLIPLAGATIAGDHHRHRRVPALDHRPGSSSSCSSSSTSRSRTTSSSRSSTARTVQLSPLVVLISVLIGAELAGILGALGAIPVAGAIQVLLHRLARSIGVPGRSGAATRCPQEPPAV